MLKIENKADIFHLSCSAIVICHTDIFEVKNFGLAGANIINKHSTGLKNHTVIRELSL